MSTPIEQEKAWSALIARLRELKAEGYTQAQLAEMLGVSPNTLSEWLKKGRGGKRIPYPDMKKRLEAVGLNPADYFSMPVRENTSVKIYENIIGSMGPGAFEGNREGDRIFSCETNWLRTLGNTDEIFGIRGCGESMWPTIPDRALVLIDPTKNKDLVNKGIYFVCYGDMMFLKRLRVNKGVPTHIISDRDESEQEIDANGYFHVIGRAVWYGKRLV